MKWLNTSSREVVLLRFSSSNTQTITEPVCLQSLCSQIYLPHCCGLFLLTDNWTWSVPSSIYFHNALLSTGYSLPLKTFHDLAITYLFSSGYHTLPTTSPNQTLPHYNYVPEMTCNFPIPSMPLFMLYPYPTHINPA